MPIKKSALLLIILSVGSVSLLIFSAAATPANSISPVAPVKCPGIDCCSQVNEPKAFTTWDMISQIMWGSAA